mmetsp:Transcript_4070/g.6424  ORF Transcript_4070/g.6424 Transcript_4070/m.6424 type:complete len:175 (-) Transcript_4070:497-1021(-)
MGMGESFRRAFTEAPKEVREEYGEEWSAQTVLHNSLILKLLGQHPNLVVNAILHAVGAPTPKIRYRVGILSQVYYLLTFLPDSWVDAIMGSELQINLPRAAQTMASHRKEWNARVKGTPEQVYKAWVQHFWGEFEGRGGSGKPSSVRGDDLCCGSTRANNGCLHPTTNSQATKG